MYVIYRGGLEVQAIKWKRRPAFSFLENSGETPLPFWAGANSSFTFYTE